MNSILMRTEAGDNSLGRLVREITERNACHPSKYLLINKHGKRMTKGMLRLRWDKAREKAQQKAIDQGDPVLAAKIGGFQFRDIRPKAASEIVYIGDASLLLGHSKQEITKRVYRRIGATAKPSKQTKLRNSYPKASERLPKTACSCPNPRNAKAPHQRGFRVNLGGKPGIRTLGTLLTFAGFQDCRLNNINQQLRSSSFPHQSIF